jgi:hypothetical protein
VLVPPTVTLTSTENDVEIVGKESITRYRSTMGHGSNIDNFEGRCGMDEGVNETERNTILESTAEDIQRVAGADSGTRPMDQTDEPGDTTIRADTLPTTNAEATIENPGGDGSGPMALLRRYSLMAVLVGGLVAVVIVVLRMRSQGDKPSEALPIETRRRFRRASPPLTEVVQAPSGWRTTLRVPRNGGTTDVFEPTSRRVFLVRPLRRRNDGGQETQMDQVQTRRQRLAARIPLRGRTA